MTLQAPKRRAQPHPAAFVPVPSSQRDALTGAPLRAGTLRIGVRQQPIKYRRPGYLEYATDRAVGAPARLHTPQAEGEAGLEYAVFFGQYLAAVVDEWRKAGALEASAWWTSSYGVNKVRNRLEDCLPARIAVVTLEAVLAVCRDHESPTQVAESIGMTYDWLGRKAQLCMALAHTPASRYSVKTPREVSA